MIFVNQKFNSINSPSFWFDGYVIKRCFRLPINGNSILCVLLDKNTTLLNIEGTQDDLAPNNRTTSNADLLGPHVAVAKPTAPHCEITLEIQADL